MQIWVLKRTVLRYQHLHSLVCNFRVQGCCKPGLWKDTPLLRALSRPECGTLQHYKLFSPCQLVQQIHFFKNSQFTLSEVDYYICCNKMCYEHMQRGKTESSVVLHQNNRVFLLHFSLLDARTSRNKPKLGELKSEGAAVRKEQP